MYYKDSAKSAKKDIQETESTLKVLKSVASNSTRLIKEATPYKDINEVLNSFGQGVYNMLEQNLIGIYLTGSLSYDDFNPGRSDIDLVIILKRQANIKELEAIRELHNKIEKNYPTWAGRLECSYVPIDLLASVTPPKLLRPYYNSGGFYTEAHYGNEWIINNYLLYEYGISLIGPEFKELISRMDIVEVQKACIRDLFQEWKPRFYEGNLREEYFLIFWLQIIYNFLK